MPPSTFQQQKADDVEEDFVNVDVIKRNHHLNGERQQNCQTVYIFSTFHIVSYTIETKNFLSQKRKFVKNLINKEN